MICRLAQFIDRPTSLSITFGLSSVFKLDSEFVSDPNSEFLIFFFSWALWLYKKGYFPH